MRYLKPSTVINGFKKHGFNHRLGNCLMYYQLYDSLCQRFFIRFAKEGSQIICEDGRWFEKSNVHIVSYWSYPHNLKELEKLIQDIKYTYNTLCHTRFEKD